MQYHLSQSTIEKLKYYVYLLKDPRKDRIFYVGKGKGNRINQHLLGAHKSATKETEKIRTIREIEKTGKQVELLILRHGLTEKEAFSVESAMIDFLGIDNLTNIDHGKYSAEWEMKVDEIEIKYEAKIAKFTEPVILININKVYKSDISKEELYEKTRGHWRIGERANQIKIVCVVYRGIIREVYVIDQWLPSSQIRGRFYFKGNIAPSIIRDKYLNKSVVEYWRKGSQNPIKYVG